MWLASSVACMPAAYLALEDVNNQKDLLPDFQLTLHSNDSEVGRTKINLFGYAVSLRPFNNPGEFKYTFNEIELATCVACDARL